jgi:hypothetical protein
MRADSALTGRGGSQTAWVVPVQFRETGLACRASKRHLGNAHNAVMHRSRRLSVVRTMTRIILYDHPASH